VGQRVYVSATVVYYEQGTRPKYVVARRVRGQGHPPKERRTYKIWVEGKAPDVGDREPFDKGPRARHTEKPQLTALGSEGILLVDPDQGYLDPPSRATVLSAARNCGSNRTRAGLSGEPGVGAEAVPWSRRSAVLSLDTGERLLTAAERAAAEASRAALRAERLKPGRAG